jgi:hypothetical protein
LVLGRVGLALALLRKGGLVGVVGGGVVTHFEESCGRNGEGENWKEWKGRRRFKETVCK